MAVSNAGADGSACLTILHTNDFHNYLTEAQALRLRHLHDSLPANRRLLLDAGDAIASGNITYRPGGEPILDRMSAIGYDAMTVGNREFHWSRVGFHCKLKRARFPVLCANVRAAKRPPSDGVTSDEDLPVQSYLLRDLGPGWRVLICGFTVPMITERMLSRTVSAYLFENPLEAAARLIPQWRAQHQPDLLIALTHIGIDRDRELAAAAPGVDLIIGGHTHTTLPEGEWVGETLIAQTGAFAERVGRILVSRALSDGKWEMKASLETL